MDLSSLPEDQRKQLQQLQQQFQEHQLQQQQQQQQQQIQDYTSQTYDPTQTHQPYDQSYYSYYQYQDPQQQQHPPQQQQYPPQQHYGYYQPDYTNAQVPVQPPAEVSVPAQIGDPGGVGYYSQQGGQFGEQQNNSGYGVVAQGLNPAAAAAVAALSQLTQFAGSMEAAEKAMVMVGMHARGRGYGPMMGTPPFMGPGPVGQSPYRGSGRRGGGPFRGHSRGNFGNRPPRSGDAGPSSHWRGRGRGRGGPRRFPPHVASSSSGPKLSDNEGAVLSEAEAEPTVDKQEEPEATQTSAQKQTITAPNKRPPQAAWCELCRVDCTSFEILEQHKNGKKHKKNLQRLEELQSAGKPVSGMQQEQKSVAESNPEVALHPETVQEGQDSKLTNNLTTESVNNEMTVGSEQQNDKAEQPVLPVAEQSNVRRGMKRKMRGGRGGKRMKMSNAARRPIEPPKPKVVIPLICDLCNVKCDTQEVFDRHLAGKKHISKLKRFEGHQAMYGPVGLQALYPPNPIAQTFLLPQGPQQPPYGPQGTYPPPGSYMPPQAHHSELLATATGTGSGFQQTPNHQVLGTGSDFDGQKAVSEVQQQSALVVTETKQNDVAVPTNAANGVSES